MNWQQRLYDHVAAAVPDGSSVVVKGSAADPRLLDGWSDLDLGLRLAADVEVVDLVPVPVWAVEDVRDGDAQTCRTVLSDGRRVDLSITGPGRLIGFDPAPDNDFRFLAATATAKLGRGDRLIGMHLTLELWKLCLVEAMRLRDHDTGTSIHRHGTAHDQLVEAITGMAAEPIQLQTRPTVIERTAELYASWRAERDPRYQPNWAPLHALTDRGIGGR